MYHGSATRNARRMHLPSPKIILSWWKCDQQVPLLPTGHRPGRLPFMYKYPNEYSPFVIEANET
jgi:hypothetical protein